MRILLAEDDLNLSIITQLCLEKIGGHTTIVKENGAEALASAQSEVFDLILLDGMMPELSGVQVATALKSLANFTTPVIFLSAKSDEKDINEFLQLGIGYISKPFDPQKICSMIDDILREHGVRSA
jgi:DNA-binding response OmpR family regulator